MGRHIADNPWSVEPDANLPPLDVIFGRTEVMKEVRAKALKVADADVPILVQGASGTGKEILAKFIHLHSRWKTGPFVKIHCPAIPGSFLESELFGYEEGALTGADRAKPGGIEGAEGGTLFLDQVADLDASSQATLLHVLENGHLCRIGGEDGKRIQVRTICASHRPLERDIQAGSFRPDLFYRISVVAIHLPPLRERREDIPSLFEYFLKFYSQKYDHQIQAPSEYILQLLMEVDWPGNIRELENLVNRYVILGSEEIIAHELLRPLPEQSEPRECAEGAVSLRRIARQAARAAERRVILQALNANQGNRRKLRGP
jgi:two-component system, NtrC family, response regulator AtoC